MKIGKNMFIEQKKSRGLPVYNGEQIYKPRNRLGGSILYNVKKAEYQSVSFDKNPNSLFVPFDHLDTGRMTLLVILYDINDNFVDIETYDMSMSHPYSFQFTKYFEKI